METWSIVDRHSSPDEFLGFVHHNEGTNNFAVKVSNILTSSVCTEIIPKFKYSIRLPYTCIYFENVALVFSDPKCENIVLFKSFNSNVAGLKILKNEDSFVVLLENKIFHKISLNTSKDTFTKFPITDERYTKLLIFEEEENSFIIVSNCLMYQRLKITPAEDDAEDIKYYVTAIKFSDLNPELAFEIELSDKSCRQINSSSMCIDFTLDGNVIGFCPITHQTILLSETLNAKFLQTFHNTEKILFLKEVVETFELCIANLYDFNVEFTVPVTKNCHIVGGFEDSAVYIDFKDDKIYIYQIQQNSPLSQLEILISARKYEEAEAFAKSNNLSPSAVLELKAKCLLTKLKKEFSHEALNELQDILKSCENTDFILNCCIEGVESDVKMCVLLDLVKNNLGTQQNEKFIDIIHQLIWKCEIYKLIELEDFTKELLRWDEFVKSDPMSLLLKLMIHDQLDIASIVWLKCYPYIVHDITQQNIIDILQSIPQEIKLNALLRWLECFIPSIVNLKPFVTNIFINWAQERILYLENSKHWPEIGIQLAEKLIPLIFNSKLIIDYAPVKAENFYLLMHCMKNINILKNSYNINIPLKEFMTLSHEDLAKLILRKAFAEDLDALLTDYFEKFALRFNINIENLIKEHIEQLINVSAVIDENKMEILLNYIFNIEEKLRCILLILKAAPIPWSKKIYSIAREGIEQKHLLSEKIRIEMVHAEIKEILMKYKCHELLNEDYGYLCRHIIRKGDMEMLADIEKITNFYTYLRDDAYLMCIHSFLQNSQTQAALNLFKKMNDNFQVMCIDAVLLKLENLLYSNATNEEIEYNYIDFLKCLNLKTYRAVIESLNNIYIMKNKFNLRISLNDYCIEETRRYIFIKWCKDKLVGMCLSEKNARAMLVLSIRVGSFLKVTKAESILILLNQSNEDMKKLLANIMFTDTLRVLDNELKFIDVVVDLIPYLDFNNCLSIRNALKFIVNLIKNCNYMNLGSTCINICSWVTTLYYSHNSAKEILSSWKTPSFYNPHVITSILPLWSEIMSKNVCNIQNIRPLCICKSEFCNDGSVCLRKLLSKLQVQQNDIYFSRISACLIMNNLQNNLSCPSWFADMNESMVKSLVSKILATEQPDNLSVSILLLSTSSPVEWLTDILVGSSDVQKKISTAQYILQCKEIYHHMNIPYKQAFHVFSENKISSKLEKYGLSFKDYQLDNNTYNVNSLLESLVNIESLNVLTLEEFCLVTGISLDQALMFSLFSILKSCNLKNDINKLKNSNMIMSSEEVLRKSVAIIDKMQNKKDLVENLITLFQQGEINFHNLTTVALNQYSYEVFLLILDLLKYVTHQQMFFKEFLMLKFLQTYERTNKPSQTELDIYSIKETFPKIGYHRLPFQPLISSDCWANLKSELTLSTYERWLPVASLLTLDVSLQEKCDMICSSAVRGSMNSKKSLNDTCNTKWTLHLQNEDLLKRSHKCIQNITNLEWAGACFYLVYQGSTPGADQVTAANMCYQFAEHWSKIQPNNILKKMQSKHLLTSTAHILHKIGLAEEKLLSLCDNPNKLIEALFNHDSILTYTECPNINAAVDEIATISGLDISSIRINILERILKQHNSQNFHAKSNIAENGILGKESIIKVCYILQGTNPMMAALYLFRIGLEENDSLENYSNRIRALQCLLSLADNDVIEKITNNTVASLWSKLWELYFINCLYHIGLEFVTGIFLENKIQAIHQIWNAKSNNQTANLLIVKIMLIYNLQVEELILDGLIKNMMKFGLSKDLKKFLCQTKTFYSKPCVEAWTKILLNPFKQTDIPITGSHKDDCYNTLKLLPICPVLSHIDFTVMWYNCIKLGTPEMATVILPHVLESERKKIIIKLGKVQPSFLQEIKSLKSKGILTADIIITVLKNTYKKK